MAKTQTKEPAEAPTEAPEPGKGIDVQDSAGFLAEYGATYDLVHLELPADLPFERFEEVAAKLGVISSAMPWLIGDAILFADAAYGEVYAQAMDLFGLAHQTLMNYASVARQVAAEVRRADLSWGHHQAVANLKTTKRGVEVPDVKAQRYWLEQTAEKQWSRGELREALRAAGKIGSGTTADDSPPTGDAGQQPPTGENGQAPTRAPEEVVQALTVIRDVFESAVPISMVEANSGYYAVPPDAMAEMAQMLDEPFEVETNGGGSSDDDLDFGPSPPLAETAEALAGAASGAPPTPQTTRRGTVVLDPTAVRGPQPPSQVPAQVPEGPMEAGEAFEGFR